MGNRPVPKPDEQRARRNKVAPMKVILAEPTAQPPLPESMPGGEPWPSQTLDWWVMWAESPLSAEYTATDWSYLLDTAISHGQLWSGDSKAAAELRLRMERFGATPADRARLRITFAQADAADAGTGTRATSSRARHSDLKLA